MVLGPGSIHDDVPIRTGFHRRARGTSRKVDPSRVSHGIGVEDLDGTSYTSDVHLERRCSGLGEGNFCSTARRAFVLENMVSTLAKMEHLGAP